MGEAVCGINEPLISVIVPVYKVEPYLRKCVDSILAQTYQNLEIILVDDGSPDGCPAICDEYAKVDQRVKVIHKANGGLSDARNAGMDAVSGDYLMFVDSDDWISCDHVENLYRFSGEKVVAVCNFHFVNEDGSITENKLNDEKFAFRKNTFGYVWNKMYPKSIIGKHYFAKVIFTEDHSFNLDVYFEGVKYEFIESTTYYYRQRKDSILHSRITLERALKFKCSSQCISKSLQEAPNYLIDESVKWEEYYRIIGNHVCDYLCELANDDALSFCQRCKIGKKVIESIDFSKIRWKYASHTLLKVLYVTHILRMPLIYYWVYYYINIVNRLRHR